MAVNGKNKVKFGLRSVYYAPITSSDGGKVTYGNPVAWPGAVNLSLSAQGETSEFYADDIAYYVTAANTGYQGDLECALIPDSFRQEILGETLSTTEKVLIENALTEGKGFALLFEFSADVKNSRHVLYNCKATRPDVSSQTMTNSKEPVTETVQITASPLADGRVKAKTTEETTEQVYNDWFTKVWEPTGVGA